ncbi:MAG: hypothetical protein ABUL44_02805, partial [Flavobacterium sp.]
MKCVTIMRMILFSFFKRAISTSSLYTLVIVGISFDTYAQPKEISSNWTSFVQSVDASFLKKKTRFKVSASVKAVIIDSTSWAGIWARVDNKDGENGFFDNMQDRPIRLNEWRNYV